MNVMQGLVQQHPLRDIATARSDQALQSRPVATVNEHARAAILSAQQGRVMDPGFKLLSQRAGCIGCAVWIARRHVSLFGRHGEAHIERLPN